MPGLSGERGGMGLRQAAERKRMQIRSSDTGKPAGYMESGCRSRLVSGERPAAGFAERLAAMAEDDGADPAQSVRDHMAAIYKKILKNNCEPTFQIGAQSFTVKEWERFLGRFDAVEEVVVADMREAHGEEAPDRESGSVANPETEEWQE